MVALNLEKTDDVLPPQGRCAGACGIGVHGGAAPAAIAAAVAVTVRPFCFLLS